MTAEKTSEIHPASTAEPPPGTPPDPYLNPLHLSLVEPSLADVYDAIRDADREINQATAKRAAAIYTAQRTLADVGRGRAEVAERAAGRRPPWSPEEATKEEFTCEVGALLRLPRRTAETLIEASRCLAEDLPATREALTSGVISYRHAQVIMEQAWGIRMGDDPVIVEPSADMRPPKHPSPGPKPRVPFVDVWSLDPTPDDPDNPTPF